MLQTMKRDNFKLMVQISLPSDQLINLNSYSRTMMQEAYWWRVYSNLVGVQHDDSGGRIVNRTRIPHARLKAGPDILNVGHKGRNSFPAFYFTIRYVCS